MKIKIICGDNRHLIKDIPDNSFELIICDPPYLTTKEEWDKKEVFTEEFVKELFRVLKPSGHLYCWCGIGEKSQSLIRWFPTLKKHFFFKDMITWKKQRGIGMRKGWLYTREECLWFVKDNKKFFWNKEHQYSNEKRTFTATYADPERMAKYKKSVKSEFKRLTNVWTDIRETNISWNEEGIEKIKFHFTPKPIPALERIIKCSTKEGDVVYSPYCGSGQDLIAAINTNRNAIGMEINPKSVSFIQKRIERRLQNVKR